MTLKPIKPYIYFPGAYDRDHDPRVIYVDADFGATLRGNPDLEQLMSGRFGQYLAAHCQPYTDELWEACQRWMAARNEVQRKYKRLMKGQLELMEMGA